MAMEITRDMTIGDVLNTDRRTADILTSFGMHCFGCPYSLMESLEDACAVHGANVDELVHQLNEFLAEAEEKDGTV